MNKGVDRISKAATPLLPKNAQEDRPLLCVMLIMAFLAGLILLITAMTHRAADLWQKDVAGTATVQITLGENQNRAAIIETATKLVQSHSAVHSLSVVTTAQARQQLEPWLGDLVLPEDLPLPILLTVKLNDDADLNTADLTAQLESENIVAMVDSHERWQGNIAHTARTVQLAMSVLFGLILLAGIMTSIFATQARLSAHRKIITVLTQVGAKNGYIARLFTGRFFMTGLMAGIIGCALSLLFALLFTLLTGSGDDSLFRAYAIVPKDLIWLMGLAIGFGGLCALTSGLTSLSLLKSIQKMR